jgi:SagB-type dehydrogenase family enzyme
MSNDQFRSSFRPLVRSPVDSGSQVRDAASIAIALHEMLAHDAPNSRGHAVGDATFGLAPAAGCVVLPTTVDDEGVQREPLTLRAALQSRRSCYVRGPDPVRLADVADLLRTSLGLSRRVTAYGRPDHPLSAAPSSGGLDSLGVHLFSSGIDGLDDGVYRLERFDEALTAELHGDVRDALCAILWQPEFADRAAVVLLLTIKLGPAMTKYTTRHYRILHVDVGVAIQNLYLVATELGLHTCAVGGFDEIAVNNLLQLDQELPAMAFVVLVGSKVPARSTDTS